MKKIFLMAIIALIGFSGCTGVVTKHEYTTQELDKAYNVGKVVYKTGKVVVKVVAPKIGTETMEALKKVDKVAISLDKVRTETKKNKDVITVSTKTK